MSFLSYLINGVSLGSIYAIIALGYTMVYGIAKMLNFAHGDVIMIGAFVVLNALNVMNLPVIPAILVAVVGCTVLGVVIERVAYRPLRTGSAYHRKLLYRLLQTSESAHRLHLLQTVSEA